MIRIFDNAQVFSGAAPEAGSVVVAGAQIVAVGKDLPAIDEAWVAERIDCGGRALVPASKSEQDFTDAGQRPSRQSSDHTPKVSL